MFRSTCTATPADVWTQRSGTNYVNNQRATTTTAANQPPASPQDGVPTVALTSRSRCRAMSLPLINSSMPNTQSSPSRCHSDSASLTSYDNVISEDTVAPVLQSFHDYPPSPAATARNTTSTITITPEVFESSLAGALVERPPARREQSFTSISSEPMSILHEAGNSRWSSSRSNRRAKIYPCSECGKLFDRPSALETHSYAHSGAQRMSAP
jgi:hypothetical protein